MTVQSSPNAAEQLLFQRFNNPQVSNDIVYHLRLLAGSWLKDNAAIYQDFIKGDLGVDGYCKEWLDAPNKEINHLGIMLLNDVLLKPVGFAVEILCLDRNAGLQVNSHMFHDKEDWVLTNPRSPIIYLLYRANHYDILYQDPSTPFLLQQQEQGGRFLAPDEITEMTGAKGKANDENKGKLTTDTLLRIPKGHLNVVTAAGFSPDDRQLASASEDKTALVAQTLEGAYEYSFLQAQRSADEEVPALEHDNAKESIESQVKLQTPFSDPGFASMPSSAAAIISNDVDQASIHDDHNSKQFPTSSTDQGGNQTRAAPTLFEYHYKPCPYRSKRESYCWQHMEKAHGWENVRSKNIGKNKKKAVDEPATNHGLPTPQTTNIQIPSSDGQVVNTPDDDWEITRDRNVMIDPHHQINFPEYNSDSDVAMFQPPALGSSRSPKHFNQPSSTHSPYVDNPLTAQDPFQEAFPGNEHTFGAGMSEAADEGLQSVVFDRDEISPQTSTRKTQLEVPAERHLSALLAQHEDLKPLYEIVLRRMGKERFVNNFRRTLKQYYLDLVQSTNTNLERATVHLLRSR